MPNAPKIWPTASLAAKSWSSPPDTFFRMPTYQYACNTCSHQLEIQQRFADDPLVTCPQCEQPALRRVIFPAGVIFKGSGWYKTDSREKRSEKSEKAEARKEKAAAKTAAAEKSDGSATKNGSAESKPAAKAASANGGAKSGD